MVLHIYFFSLFYFFVKRALKYKFKNRIEILNNSKIGTFCTVSACSQFIKNNRKRSSSNRKKRENKEEMLGKTMAG